MKGAARVIRFESVSLSYRGGGERSVAPDVLRDVNLDLAEGTFHWLLGASGSGKTTLLRLMNMSLRPTRGTVSVLGTLAGSVRRADRPRLRRQIGAIFQDFRLLPHLSAFDNVALPLRLGGRPESQVQADVKEMLRWMGLAERLASMPEDLSSGERQSVAIARAVISRPRLLLADEPTSGLDAAQSERAIHLLRELHRLGSTVIVATYARTQAKRYPEPTLLLSRGTLVRAE